MDRMEEKQMKIGIYARESSDDTRKAPPIAEQIARGRQWAAEEGHDVVVVYADNGYSGGDWKRPDWLQSVKDAKRHLWGLLWTWDQDRLARDTEQFLWYSRNLRGAGVQIWEHTAKALIDMETLGGRVKHQTMAQAAEIFRLVTSEKVKRTYEARKKEGKPWGRPAKEWDQDRAMVLRVQGMGWREIAKEVGVSYQTVRRVLLNRAISEHPEDHKQKSRENGAENHTGIL